MLDYVKRYPSTVQYQIPDPLVLSRVFQEMATRAMTSAAEMATDPSRLLNAQLSMYNSQMKLWSDYMELWRRTTERVLLNKESAPIVKPASDDKRFKDDQWVANYLFDFIKQSYLIAAGHIQSFVADADGFDDHTKKKLAFYTRQWVDGMAPTNFATTNPQVLKATLESGGENLYKGLVNLLSDLERGKGKLSIKMTDLDGFKLGENVAVTPGKVVYQNDMIQLIQYTPTTTEVYRRPLLIVPPWINKYYILDLKAKNSFIKWAVDQGHSVFVMSWVNPDEKLSHKTFDNYLLEGPLAALDVVEKITGEHDINAIGYCLGGTLLSIALSYLANKGDDRIKSATFFTTLVEFTEVGELSVFIDEEQLLMLESQMERRGYLEGNSMADAFNMMRANDLIWSFVVNNYLLGKEPGAFDLLYWNTDATRMPAPMHKFYLRNFYQKNLLRKPGGITLAGVPIDLSKVNLPIYYISAREDHIAPWRSTYTGMKLMSGPKTFVLGGSGHIAGIINPPAANKYCYWVNNHDEVPNDSEDWFKNTTQYEGSWWTHWAKWVAAHDDAKIPARTVIGSAEYPPIEDAPGSYVKVRII